MSDLDKLCSISNFYGSNPDFVIAGGGNTSVKIGDILYIKPSGTSLGTIRADEFVAMDREKVRNTLAKNYSSNPIKREDQIKQDLLDARIDFKPDRFGPRASVETAMHEIINYTFVVHTHPHLVNGLACGKNGKKAADKLFGGEYLRIDSSDPGYTLPKLIASKLRAYRRRNNGSNPNIIFLQNHGLIISADTIDEIKSTTNSVINKIKDYIEKYSNRRNAVFIYKRGKLLPEKENILILRIASPTLRGLLSSDIRKVVSFDNSPEVQKVLSSKNGRAIVTGGTFTPDHIVYCRERPLWIDPSSYKESEKAFAQQIQTSLKYYKRRLKVEPKIVIIEGVGMLAVGDSINEANIARDMYKDYIRVAENTAAFGGLCYLTRPKANFIEKWEVESYRRKLIGKSSHGRIENRIAIVTGGGQGIGEGIAMGLAKEGAYVVVTDINIQNAKRVAGNINSRYGGATALKVDVRNSEDIKSVIDTIVELYGGVDIFVNNAGILISGPTESLTDKQLEIMTLVNYQAFFKAVRETVGVMKHQNRFNRAFTSDIVLISSKSGLQGSAANSLYAGAKFGGIGLMQSFAYEFVKYGIKVNAVCPGNFFEGQLWSDEKNGLFVQYLNAGKVPEAKNVDDVRKYYEEKCLMGKGVGLEDINRAVIYAVEQQYETGQAIPVTGGQVMLK